MPRRQPAGQRSCIADGQLPFGLSILGGIGGSRPAEIGPVTEYVLRRAPCRVLITAPQTDGSRRSTAATELPSAGDGIGREGALPAPE